MLRAVAADELKPEEALARMPEVDDEKSVPSAYWSVRYKLELEIELRDDELIDPIWKAHFAEVLRKLADRIEGIARIP